MNNTIRTAPKLLRSAVEIRHLIAAIGITGGDSRQQH